MINRDSKFHLDNDEMMLGFSLVMSILFPAPFIVTSGHAISAPGQCSCMHPTK